MNESDTAPPRPGRVARVASGAALVVLLLVGAAAPAGATPTNTLSVDPSDDVSAPPTVNGSFKGASLLVNVEKISAVTLKVSPSGPTGGDPVTQNGCQVATAGACNTAQISFAWEIPTLEYNGPYVVEASGQYCDPLLCLNPETNVAAPVEFRLGADPKAPADLKAEPGDERSVVISWARNGEPDLQYYALFRKDPGGDFRRLGNDIKQPGSGRPSFTDTSAAGTSGGDFVYKVFAVRNGHSGDTTTNRISKASSERTAFVAPPPTTTNPGGEGGPVTTVAGQGVDIGSFLSGQAPTLPTPGPIFLDLPDTGFGELLPFGSLPDEAEPGEEDAVLPTTPRQRQIAEFKANRPLIPVAAGLLLLVLSAHIRLLNVRTKAAPEKPPPGAYVARALEEARSVRLLPMGPADLAPLPVDVATAVANGGHHRAPPPLTDDLADLPVWAEFEPVSALGLLDDNDDGHDDERYAPPRPPAVLPAAVLPAPVLPAPRFAPTPEARFAPEPEVPLVPEPEVPLAPMRRARFAPKARVAPEPEALSAPEADARFAPEAEERFAPVAEAPADPEDDPEAMAVVPPKTKANARSRVKAEPTSRDNAGPKSRARAESRSKAKPQPRSNGKAAAAANFEPEPEPEPPVAVAPEPVFEPDLEPEPDPRLVYASGAGSDWASEPEVFVGPRR